MTAVRFWLVCAAAFAAIVTLQFLGGAYAGDFDAIGGDESAHFVTGLMIRDYALDGFRTAPIAFAERYYLSYPRVAFGIWPPLFHLLGGGWFFVFGASRAAALILMALMAAGIAALVYRESAARIGQAWGIGIAAALATLVPLTWGVTSYFGADVMVSLLMVAASLAWARFLETGEARDSAAFGFLAALALLTKYNALALALLPPLSVAAGRRWDLPKRPAFWLPAAMVVAIAGPWYAAFWKLVVYAGEMGPQQISAAKAVSGNTGEFLMALGPAGAGLWLLATWRGLRDPGRRFESALGAFIVSVLLFHSVMFPFVQDRYLYPAVAAAVICAGSELARLAQGWRYGRWAAASAMLAAAAWTASWGGPSAGKHDPPALSAVADAITNVGPDRLLISSSGGGEGAFIAAVAMRDQERPASIVLRSSKLLARTTWMHDRYELLYANPDDVERRLDELRVGTVVVDHDTRPVLPHQALLARTLSESKGRWLLAREVRKNAAGAARARCVRVYRRAMPFRFAKQPVELDMRFTLGRSLKLTSAVAP